MNKDLKRKAGKVSVDLSKMKGHEAKVVGLFMAILAGMAPKPAKRRKTRDAHKR